MFDIAEKCLKIASVAIAAQALLHLFIDAVGARCSIFWSSLYECKW
jgi:hypothetical protein